MTEKKARELIVVDEATPSELPRGDRSGVDVVNSSEVATERTKELLWDGQEEIWGTFSGCSKKDLINFHAISEDRPQVVCGETWITS